MQEFFQRYLDKLDLTTADKHEIGSDFFFLCFLLFFVFNI